MPSEGVSCANCGIYCFGYKSVFTLSLLIIACYSWASFALLITHSNVIAPVMFLRQVRITQSLCRLLLGLLLMLQMVGACHAAEHVHDDDQIESESECVQCLFMRQTDDVMHAVLCTQSDQIGCFYCIVPTSPSAPYAQRTITGFARAPPSCSL